MHCRYMQENPTAGLAPGEELPDIEYDEDGNPIFEKKKHIDPLPPIDHKEIDYKPFERFFYTEHPEIAGEWVKQLDIACHPGYRIR